MLPTPLDGCPWGSGKDGDQRWDLVDVQFQANILNTAKKEKEMPLYSQLPGRVVVVYSMAVVVFGPMPW